MRKLASIQKISSIEPHPNADNLLIAKVRGFEVIISKNDKYTEGERVVYFETDSFLPCVEDYEFLRKSCYRNDPILGEGFLIKPFKLRGVISNGLILPINICFKNCMPLPGTGFRIDEDVTELLNVKKWEEPNTASLGTTKGKRPTFIKKTDETRIQRFPEILEEFYNCDKIYASVKIDGSSHSIGIDSENDFFVTSHNKTLIDDNKPNTFYSFCKYHNLEERLGIIKRDYGLEDIVVQGEFYGPGIQKNKLGLSKPNWMIFTVDFNRKRQNLDTSKNVADLLGISFVPILDIWTGEEFKNKFPDIKSIMEYIKGDPKNLYVDGEQEGVVFRPTEPCYSKILDTSLSIKVINENY